MLNKTSMFNETSTLNEASMLNKTSMFNQTSTPIQTSMLPIEEGAIKETETRCSGAGEYQRAGGPEQQREDADALE